MNKLCHIVGIALLMLGLVIENSFALTKPQIDALDGNIVLINERGGMNGGGVKIQILDADERDWSKKSAILWEYKLSTGKDGLTISTGKFNDCKRVLNDKGEECLLLAGKGFALFNLETEKFDVSNKEPDSKTHSAEILPGGRFVLARSDYSGDDLEIYGSGKDSKTVIDSDEHNNAHAANYDAENECIWTYGAQGVRKYSYDKSTGKLGTYEKISGNSGSHDLSPKFGTPGVFYACGGELYEYTVAGSKWRKLSDIVAKCVSYNRKRDELLVPIKSGSQDGVKPNPYQSFRCQALTPDGEKIGKEYVMPVVNGSWYKARWFVHNTLSHPLEEGENRAPAFTSDPFTKPTGEVGVAYQRSLLTTAIDPDGDPLTYSIIDGPSWASISNGRVIIGTPAVSDTGLNEFTIRVVDLAGLSDTATLKITIDIPTPINQQVVQNDSFRNRIRITSAGITISDALTNSVQVEIVNLNGQKLLTQTLGKGFIGTVSLPQLSPSAYLVRLQGESISSVQKLIIR